MSNPFRAIGKAFKKVLSVAKKIAIPAIAIGAAVLTGGAALGITPAFLGANGIGASLGISQGLTSVLATAGKGALGGMITSAVTGGSIKKGAVLGFAAGGVAGGLKQLVNPVAELASGAAKGAGAISGSPSSMGLDSLTSRGATAAATFPAQNGIGAMIKAGAPTSFDLQSAMGPAPKSLMPALTSPGSDTFASRMALTEIAPAKVAPAAASVNAPLEAARTTVSPATTATASSGGGIAGLIERNQFLASGLIQGVGNGISAKAQADSEAKQAEARRQQIIDNYGSGTGFYSGPTAATVSVPQLDAPRGVWRVDPRTGNLYKDFS